MSPLTSPVASQGTGERDRSWGAVCVGLLTIGLLLALLTLLGSDLLWLVALGDEIRAKGTTPDGVPFAAAASQGWPPVVVAAEVVLSLIHELGVGGLLAWHFVVVLVALVLVAADARRRGASDVATAVVLVALFFGAAGTFAVVRLQTFSLIPFAVMVSLLRAQHIRASRAMWWAPVLVAIWGNLHGSVLLGVCMIGAYLMFSRLRNRPVETVALGVATLAALFATPATWRTGEYYVGVFQNESAAQREGLWAAPNLVDPFDLVMLATALVLGWLALRHKLALWEYVVIVGLASATLMAARNGVWLLIFLAAPAASGSRRLASESESFGRPPTRVLAVTLALLLACASLLVHRGEAVTRADELLSKEVRRIAPGQVVLAPEPAVESLAVHGVRVWLSNPLDAFRRADQRAYLDFLAGRPGMMAAVDDSGAVLVRAGAPSDRVMVELPGFEVFELEDSWRLYVRN